jgi:acylphosphatase
MAAEIALRVRVTGRVQGVWYRGWTEAEARRRGLRGWVRNEPDGSVLAVLAGPPAEVAAMTEAMRHGPPDARVAHLESSATEDEGWTGFEVRRSPRR